jgi:hypothetical protein
LPTDLATGDHNNKYYLVRGGPDSKLFKIVNNIAVQHFVETYLDNLEDVIISSQTSRDVLMFKNGAWRNSPDVANDIDSLMVKGFVLEDAINLVAQNLQNHINNLSNPHNVTKQQVGLGNVDNTSDYNKPVSNPTQIEIDKQVPRSFLDVPNGIPVLDSFNKIQAKNLPNILFDGLEFASVISSSTYLSFLAHTVSNATRSQVGFYWVATTTVNVISFSYTATPPFGGTEYYKTYFVPSDEGTIQQEGVSLTTTLEAGDWIVITKKDGAGTQANPYIYYFAVVNNTYEDATSALRGIVTLSSSTSTATISNNVITDSVLKDLITTETGVANKISASQHTHPISEVDDLQTELDDLNTAVEGKAEEVHTHVKADITDFAHTHAISEVNGLQTALDGKAEEVHTHVKADITDFAHTHAAGDIVSGTLSSSVLASGVADETTFLRGDGVWAPLTGEGGGGVLAGAGVANQIAYFTASDVVSSLSTTTYPSLTELSYVKGVTVPIQDHIDDESNPHNVTVAQINAEPANANIQAHISSTSNPHSVTANQIGAEPAFTKNTAFNKNFGNTAGTVTEGNDPRLSDARTPLSHTHVSADITDLKENLKYLYIYGKAQSAITKGQAVQFAGVQGDHILLKPAVPSEINTNPDYFVGLAETTLASEDFGYVLTHGELSGINTSSYTEGAILWFASAGSTAGALTQTEPTGLNARIQVAAVNRTNPGNGIIFVRVHNVGVQVQDIVASGTRSASSFLNGEGQWAAPSTEGFVYGNGTANQLSYFTGPTEIASLDTATYPSLTEVSYVKGVTSAIQTQLNSKANLASPELTGTPLAPTATSGTNTTQIATTAFVSTAVANLINSAPGALDTLDELAAALGDDSSFASTVTTALAGKSPVGHPHSTADITTGIFSPSRLGTGTYSGVTFLNGLGQYVSVTNELGEGFLPLAGGTLTGTITIGGTSNKALSVQSGTDNRAYFGTFNDFALIGVNRNPSTGDFADLNKASADFGLLGANGDSAIIFGTTTTNGGLPSERMRITGAGNVGIGTNNPPQKLSVSDGNINISSGFLYFNNGDVEIGRVTTDSGSGAYFKTWTGSALTEKMRINGNGNVGIGTTSPQTKLEISADLTETARFSYSGAPTSYYLRVRQNNPVGGIVRWHFDTRNNDTQYDNTLVLDRGYVGIGTTSPQTKLDVNGGLDVRGNFRLTGPATTTNQSRTIEFTGFDKEGTDDFSDNAYIRHTVNSGGLTGSVLEISSQNDAQDGINFITPTVDSFRHNGNIIVTGANIGAQTVSTASQLPTLYYGGQQLNPQTYFGQGVGVKVAMTGTAGLWSDTMWINGYSGGDVLQMVALHTQRNGEPRMYLSAQASNASSYGTLHEVITNFNLSSITQLNSGSDFPNGTLVYTDIWYADFAGDSFQIEIEGKSYGQVYPWMVRGQGYIYSNSIINQGFVDYTGNFGSLTAFNLNNYLCFWWPRQSYWNSFSVKVWSSSTYGATRNRVTGIADSGIPGNRTREVGFPRLRVWNNSNLTFSLSGSTLTINAG